MSDNIDFKKLWNKQEAHDVPDIKALLEKADRVKRKGLCKLIGLNLMMLLTISLVIFTGLNIDVPLQLTTKLGIILMIVAIVSYLIAYNQMMPLLFKSNLQSTSHEYLNQLIAINRKMDFLNKVMINVYFILLSTGLAMYMLQFAERMSTFGATAYYIIIFAWIAFAWFYLRPRRVRKKQEALQELIARLEEVNKQLDSE